MKEEKNLDVSRLGASYGGVRTGRNRRSALDFSRLNPGPVAGALLLILVVSLGGTSSLLPGRAMVFELVAILALWLNLGFWRGPRIPTSAIVMIGCILGLPLLQLVPLPYSVWSILPGRGSAVEQAQFLGGPFWRPITLDNDATTHAFLTLLLPVAAFLSTLNANAAHRRLCIWAIILLALASLTFALVQIALRDPSLAPFPTSHLPRFIGFFANRNHQAAFLYVAVSLAIGAAATRHIAWLERLLLIGSAIVLCAGVIVTQSRTALTLLALVVGGSALMFLPAMGKRSAALGALAGFLCVVVLVSGSGVLQSGLSRFTDAWSDGRLQYWPAVWYATVAYLPTGAGLGTFVASYQAMEPLGLVSDHYLNHAHNDYLQLLLEAGAFGILILCLFLTFLFRRAANILKVGRITFVETISRGALLAVVALMLHSAVDYPLRTYALMTVFGALCGLLYSPRFEPDARAETRDG